MRRIEKLKTEKKLGIKFHPSISESEGQEDIKENIEYLEEYLERLKELENIRLRKLEMMSALSKKFKSKIFLEKNLQKAKKVNFLIKKNSQLITIQQSTQKTQRMRKSSLIESLNRAKLLDSD